MSIFLAGTGINTDDDVYGTLQLRYNQKNSDAANRSEDRLFAVVAKKLKLSVQAVKEALSVDTDGAGMPDWF